jgi:pentatricopeptide repeat protein
MGLCVAWDQWDYVLKLLELIQRHGLHPQEYSTYRTSLQTCWEYGNARAALDILHAMQSAQLSLNPTDIGLVVSTLCKSCQNTGGQTNVSTTQWRQGWNMLQAAATVPISHKEENHHHHYRNDHPGDQAALYSNVIPIKAYHDVLDCMKKEKRWQDSVRCLRWMEQGNVTMDKSITTAINNKSHSNNNMDCSDLSYKSYNFFIPTPTLSTYQTVMECCLENQQVDAAVQILYHVTKTNKTASTLKPSTFHVVLAALAKTLQWREALQLLEFMVEWDIPRTVVTYNTVISACAKAREVGMAKSLLHRMKQRDNIRPDEISYNSVIGACANTARWKEALDVLDQCYREPGVIPNIFIYTNAMR